MEKQGKILIVDDMEDYLSSLKNALMEEFETVTAKSLEEGKDKMDDTIDLALLDIRLDEKDASNRDGILLLEWIKMNYPETPCIMMSAYKEFDLAVDSLNLGASYFLRKPINLIELKALLKTFLEKTHLERENIRLREELKRQKGSM